MIVLDSFRNIANNSFNYSLGFIDSILMRVFYLVVFLDSILTLMLDFHIRLKDVCKLTFSASYNFTSKIKI